MRRQQNQGHTHPHTQESHENRKLEGVMYTHRTWCTVYVYSTLVSASFRRPCSHGVLKPFCLTLFLPPLLQGSLSDKGREFMETFLLWLSV